jgi:hypothetical protein
MGKTKLCKDFRDTERRESRSVDLDYKGVTLYSDEVRLANSTLAAALLSDGHDIVTGCAGQFNYRQLLIDRVNITFALPVGKLLDSLPERASKRGDSIRFIRLLEDGRFEFAYHIWTDYCDCLDAWRQLIAEARAEGCDLEASEITELRPVLVYSSSSMAYVSDFVTLSDDSHLRIDIDDDHWHPFRADPKEQTVINALRALAEGYYYEI